MNEFNQMTIAAAAEVLVGCKSHSDLELVEVQWGISGRSQTSSRSARAASLAKLAIEEDLHVMTVDGRVSLERALIEETIKAPESYHQTEAWKRLVAGLRFDGFEIISTNGDAKPAPWGLSAPQTTLQLLRMLPEDIPETDFREAESELVTLLKRHGFTVAEMHLSQALSAFQRGEWSSSNGELRNFFESYLNQIAVSLGYNGTEDSKAKRDFLGNLDPPFLLTEYNEWNANNQKPQYVQGLMSRMHPHGGHPGLSEEEDSTFRLQISLVTARLFLRRFDKRRRA